MSELKKRRLGKSGIDVSEVGFGLWAAGGNMWGPTVDQDILDAIDLALDAGVNFYDTADVYGNGHSEELLGRAMAGRRERFIVASKIGWIGFNEETRSTAYDTKDKLISGVENNLRRLNSDYIDIIQSHISFRDPTMEVFLEGFRQLQQDGKVRAFGVSTSNFNYLKEFNAAGDCATLQIDYSILNRTSEADCLPYCQDNNIGVIIRGALAMGILTGKFNAHTQFAERDFRQNWQNNADEHAVYLQDLEKVEKLRPMAEGRSLAQLATQFTLAHPVVSTVIPGAKNRQQMRENLEAAMLAPLSDDEMAHIAAITPARGGRKIWPA
jgi:aryl-alcohol dehydrogenase-like predicted oxidoreductase